MIFIDGNDFRAAELRVIAPDLAFTVESLSTGFATSAPEPEHKARDKVLAHAVPGGGAFAEAVDLMTMDGKSMRLELDSGNANRFCKWWRETPAKVELCVALRRAPDAEIEVFSATCIGRIADQPAGPLVLGWDRLFVPTEDNEDEETLAQIAARGEVATYRAALYRRVFGCDGLVSGRFADRATQPARGPGDILRWKLGKKEPRRADFAELDAVRPGVRDGGAAALASGAPVAVWIGHATWALRLGGQLVLTDPIWANRIGGAVKRLVPPGVALAELPAADVVLVTHDHRDHMDLPTLAKLPDTATYVVPAGNAGRLGKAKILELDWWETTVVGALEITLVPSRHWSMRMPWNRNDTLWGGYVIRGPEGIAYHSGDTAWGDHFAEIGARFAIDWAMLPIGGYAPRWFMEPQHVDPIEAARGFAALGARHMLAMHWGTYRLTDEAIGEPPARLRAHWAEHGLADDRLWILDAGEARSLVSSR